MCVCIYVPKCFWFIMTFRMGAHIFLHSHGIEKIAWDASGERLAVSYKGGDDVYRGLIAIYDARRTPLISASLMYVLFPSLIIIVS